MKKIALSALSIALLSTGANAASYKLNMGTVLAPENPITQGLKYFEKEVEKATDGDIEISIFPSGQLGGTLELIEQARAGAAVSMMADPSRLQDYVPQFGVLAAPYLFDNYAQSQAFYSSDIFTKWKKELKDNADLMILSANWFQGTRMLVTKKEINTPSDLEGQRIRAAGSPVGIKTVEVLGATPTPLPWNEAYTALQQKVIDGAEVHPAAFYDSKLYEVAEYIQPTNHAFLMTYFTVGAKWFDSLPKEYQQIVLDKASEAGNYASNIIQENEKTYIDKSIENGMTFHDVDIKPFQKNASNVFKDLDMEEAYKDVLAAVK